MFTVPSGCVQTKNKGGKGGIEYEGISKIMRYTKANVLTLTLVAKTLFKQLTIALDSVQTEINLSSTVISIMRQWTRYELNGNQNQQSVLLPKKQQAHF